MEAVRPVAPRYSSMLCDVLPGAIVMVEALRSVGIYAVIPDIGLYVADPLSGVVFDQALPYRSVNGAPDVVPPATAGLPIYAENICADGNPASKLCPISKPSRPAVTLLAPVPTLILDPNVRLKFSTNAPVVDANKQTLVA